MALTLLVMAATAIPAPAQPPATAKRDELVKARLATFREFVKARKKDKDPDALKVLDELLIHFGRMHPKDKKAVASGLAEPLIRKSIKRSPEKSELFKRVVVALGAMGEVGSSYLFKAYDNKDKFPRRKNWRSLRVLILENIGKTKDPKQITFLTKRVVREDDDDLLNAAGAALRYYKDEPLARRKVIVKALVNRFESVETTAHRAVLDPYDVDVLRARRRLAKIADAWNQTLQALTGQKLRGGKKWRNFVKENKNKDWDAMAGKSPSKGSGKRRGKR